MLCVHISGRRGASNSLGNIRGLKINNYLLKKILSSALFFSLAIVIECYMFATIGWGAFPVYALFDIGIILFISFIVFACPSTKASNSIICVVLGFEILICYTNIIIKTAMNTVFAIKMLNLAGETAAVLRFDMFPWAPLIFYGIVVAVLAGSLVFLSRIPINENKKSVFFKHVLRFSVAIGLSLSMFMYSIQTLFLQKAYLMGDNYLYNTFSDSQQSLRKFGVYTYYCEDLLRLIYKPSPLFEISKKDVEKYLATETYDPKDSPLWNIANGKQNIFVIMAESFEWYPISKELTPVLYALANGYDFGENASRLYDIYDFANECEDGTLYRKDYLYDEDGLCIGAKDAAPAIYSDDYNNTYGLTLINYYSKAKTDYSEDSVILGNYPFNQSYVEYLSFSKSGLYNNVGYDFTLPSALKDSGYIDEGQAWYFHTYMQKFYGRNTLIPMFGFDKTTFYEDFTKNENIEKDALLSHAIRDSEVMRYYASDFVHENEDSDKPWLSFFTTVTTHGEYITYNPRLYKNYVFLDHVDYAGKSETTTLEQMANESGTKAAREFWRSTTGMAATYLAGCLDTEYMVARLIDKLVQTNQFNKTTIVFYADHNGYYNQLDLLYKSYYYNPDYTDYSEFRIDYIDGKLDLGAYDKYSSERYSVPAFIYSTALNESVCGTVVDEHDNTQKLQYIEKFTCAFDILPTILTICGVEYNPHYYLGYPVMCPIVQDGEIVELGSKVIISHTGGYFNNYIFSEDGVHANYLIENASMKQFYNDCVQQLEKWYYITALYNYNYFKKVPKTK